MRRRRDTAPSATIGSDICPNSHRCTRALVTTPSIGASRRRRHRRRTQGADRLDGRTGNDTLVGGDGTDTYVFGRDRGRDAIEEQSVSQKRRRRKPTPSSSPPACSGRRNAAPRWRRSRPRDQPRRQRSFACAALPHHRTCVRIQRTGEYEFWPSDQRIERIRFATAQSGTPPRSQSRTMAGTHEHGHRHGGNDVFIGRQRRRRRNEAANARRRHDPVVGAAIALRRNVERLALTGFVDLNAGRYPATHELPDRQRRKQRFDGPGTVLRRGRPVACRQHRARHGLCRHVRRRRATTPITSATRVGGQVSRRRLRATTPSCLNGPTGRRTSCPPTSRR